MAVDVPQQNEELQRCISECLNCYAICTESKSYWLEQGGQHAEPTHIALLDACAEICRTSAHFMLIGSDLHSRTCGVCAEVCDRCAESCEQLGDDEQMRACADACRRCAESCRRMAA
jgi:hypothetical protein